MTASLADETFQEEGSVVGLRTVVPTLGTPFAWLGQEIPEKERGRFMTVAPVLASLVPIDWPRPLRLTVKIILPIVAMALSMAILVFAFDIAGLLLDFHAAVHGFPFGNGSRKEF